MAISRLYVRSALRNPLAWLAASASLAYTVITSIDEPFFLARAGLHLSATETFLHIIGNNALYTTWGLFLPYVIILAPVLHDPERERLLAVRAQTRSAVWTAKILAATKLAALVLVAAFTLIAAVTIPGRALSLARWTDAFVETSEKAANDAEHLLLDAEAYRVANAYLASDMRPWAVTASQIGVMLLAFVAAASLCAVLGLHLPRSSVAVIATCMWWLLVLLPPGFAAVWLISPQYHILLSVRSMQFPYWVSAAYLLSCLTILNIIGWSAVRKGRLG